VIVLFDDMITFISTTEAGQRLGLTREQVLRRIGRGDLRAQQVGGRWLVDAHSLAEYLARHAEGAHSVGEESP
jgi:excisionase family DNA binding protein